MALSMAPLKYRNILSSRGGPVERLMVRQGQLLTGEACFESYVYLKESLRPSYLDERGFQIYGSVDGTGAAKWKNQAIYRAISEAVERWAFRETHISSSRKKYGFDINATTDGMAAFPGITRTAARQAAFYEALERATICEWWERNANHESISVDGYPWIKGIEV